MGNNGPYATAPRPCDNRKVTVSPQIPDGFELVRSTPEFDQDSVPKALLNAHRVAIGVWGLAIVGSGTLDFTFEDDGITHRLQAGESMVIPPSQLHHVAPVGDVSFHVEFYRDPVH